MSTAQTNEALQNLRAEVISAGVTSATSVHVASASGAVVRDVEGREYLDFGGGIGVMNVGHCHPKVVAAIKAQAEKFHHTCFMVSPYEVAIRLADRLCRLTPGSFPKKAVLVNSGAEAVENAVKIARAATRRPAVIVFENAYHGRTLLTMSMTSKVKPYKLGFGPFAPEIYRMPFGDKAEAATLREVFLTQVNPEAVACVVAEPVQGEGGFIAPPPGYFQALAAICREHGILLVADEIQCGMGRTGTMFAIEHWGVEPDLVTVGKSLGAGLPIAAVVGRRDVMDAVHPWGLGGTYGANPIASAAALAVLDLFEEEGMLARARALGATLGDRFEAFRQRYRTVGEVRGLGAMRGLALVGADSGEPSAEAAKALASSCLERGLIVLTCGTHGNVVRTLIPFVITSEQLERGLAILEQGLAELSR